MKKELIKINSVAQNYGISARALRYYEEIGLISSVRENAAQSRSYDLENLEKLRQIIVLKRIGFSIEDIKEALISRDSAINVCKHKLRQVRDAKRSLRAEEHFLHNLLALLMNNGSTVDGSIDVLLKSTDIAVPFMETKPVKQIEKEKNVMKKLLNEEVRIVTLNPMRAAFFSAVSEHPENDAVDTLMKWVKDNGIDKAPHTRYFGYDTSHPSEGNPSYGYEFCVTIEDDVQPDAPIGVKTLSGGLYAVSSLYGYDIPVA